MAFREGRMASREGHMGVACAVMVSLGMPCGLRVIITTKLQVISIIIAVIIFLSSRTGRALAWHSDGLAFASQWLQQVL